MKPNKILKENATVEHIQKEKEMVTMKELESYIDQGGELTWKNLTELPACRRQSVSSCNAVILIEAPSSPP